MKRMQVIDSRKYYPKVGVGFQVDAEYGDANAEIIKRPLVEQVANKYGFHIIGVTRETTEPGIQYCVFELESTSRAKSHEAWLKRVHQVLDEFPGCMRSSPMSPWQMDYLQPYFKACKLQHARLQLDGKSTLYKAAVKISRTMDSLHEYIVSREPSEQSTLVRSKEFEHLADTLEYYLEWMNENIEHMAR